LRVKVLVDAAAVRAYIEAHEQLVDIAANSIPESAVQQVPESESGFDADEHPMSTQR
jgi:hypothetical protein